MSLLLIDLYRIRLYINAGQLLISLHEIALYYSTVSILLIFGLKVGDLGLYELLGLEHHYCLFYRIF